jgi:hypothetical protein
VDLRFIVHLPQQIRQNHGIVRFMTKNLSHAGKQNPNRVNIHEDRAVRVWTDKFGCTKQQLEQAVKKVGSASGAVRAELGRKVPLRPQ